MRPTQPRRAAATQKPRIVTSPETLRIGDVIAVTWPERSDGIIITETAIIGTREHDGQYTLYNTPRGGHIFSTGPAIKAPKIVLLKQAKDLTSAMLDGV